MHRNGELRVLKIMATNNINCIFDIGANEGDWTVIAASLMPKCTIHAFEIIPKTYKVLLRNTRHLNIFPNNIGLSNNVGSIDMYLGSDSLMSTSCLIEVMYEHNNFYKRRIKCKTIEAYTYINTNKIKKIDFVKIDVEGMDLKVIKGFGDKIRCVRAFQFEYGIFNIASHDLLADFYKYLNEKGYIIGKIFPNCVTFLDYNFSMENFHGSNFLAIRSDEILLINRLKSYGI